MRALISIAGVVVSIGFLAASGTINYLFGHALGRTPFEAQVYGMVSVFAVAFNGLAPFFLHRAWTRRDYLVGSATAILWSLCLLYAASCALGFAANNRTNAVAARSVSHEGYKAALAELADLKDQRQKTPRKNWRAIASLNKRIDALRAELRRIRSTDALAPPDPQARLISTLVFRSVSEEDVRFVLSILFALLVEAGAALGLFVSVVADTKHSSTPVSASKRWQPRGHRYVRQTEK